MPGLYYKEYKIDQTFDYLIRRMVTETDNLLTSYVRRGSIPMMPQS